MKFTFTKFEQENKNAEALNEFNGPYVEGVNEFKRPWVGLSDAEVGKYSDRLNGGDIAREVEAKLKERNT